VFDTPFFFEGGKVSILDSVLDKLIELHKIDSELNDLRKRCREIPVQMDHISDQLNRAKEKIETTKNIISSNEKRIRSNEKMIESHREQQGKYRAQLFKLKSNREYQALNSEISLLDDKISELETDILEVMEQIDKGNNELGKLTSDLKQQEAIIIAQHQDLEKDLKSEQEALGLREKDRADVQQSVDPEIMSRYDRLVRKHGSAVAEIVTGNCGGCFVRIRPQLSAMARSNDQLVNCEKCGRYLFWTDVSES
jgi:uncharacterized protein